MATSNGLSQAVDSLQDPKVWFNSQVNLEQQVQLTLELASGGTVVAERVCDSLVRLLAEGTQEVEGTYLKIAIREFQSRSEAKDFVKRLLNSYEDGHRLQSEESDFMRELLTHHPSHHRKSTGLQAIAIGQHPKFHIPCFYVIREGDQREDFSYVRCVDNAPTAEVRVQLAITHTLVNIIQLAPAVLGRVLSIMEERFPAHKSERISVEKHRNWVLSLLYFCRHAAKSTGAAENILTLIVRKMVEIDVEISNLEEDAVREDGVDRMAQILDAMMMVMFEFLQQHLAGDKSAENGLMGALLRIFEACIMNTHRSRCVQFLVFYATSLKPAWTEEFLSLCLRSAYSPASSLPKRIVAFAYVASFVARAEWLPLRYAFRTTQYVCQFAREHIRLRRRT